jgi:hypothetical protein
LYADVRPTFKIGQIELYAKPQVLHENTPPPLFFYFLFTYLFSIKFLYFFIISSLFPYFNLFVSIFIQSYANSNWHVSILYSISATSACAQNQQEKLCTNCIFFLTNWGMNRYEICFYTAKKKIYIYICYFVFLH